MTACRLWWRQRAGLAVLLAVAALTVHNVVAMAGADDGEGPRMFAIARDVASGEATPVAESIGFDDLIARLKDADIVILGEIHDAADHHIFQARVVRALSAARSEPPALVFEHFDADQQAALDTVNARLATGDQAPSVTDFKARVAWDTSGWPKDIFDPLFAAAFASRTPLYAGNASRDQVRAVAKAGLHGGTDKPAGLDAKALAELALDQPLGPALDAASNDEIDKSHCGMIPKTAFAGMALAQRYRDAVLADATLKAAKTHGQAVLITGATHARHDRGVPWYVTRRAPSLTVVSVTLWEAGAAEPASAVLMRDPEGRPVTDFLVLTKDVARPDPCLEMRRQMAK